MVHACVFIGAEGKWDRFLSAENLRCVVWVEFLAGDWRFVLVEVGGDWLGWGVRG
ncbi:predicted protein [Sclerotinia sclerotiorum 1980 UF-70]|uniref:Uncharacterized protein n=1 Tax=Sclerotinia sclerotiorum (strain ATCC 18683 / 1980 / Ss-1) TaxID=665079 RepID=A7EG35_SCLS1|nr:predicted protein [Sclerotinia sclerotiorum 1980 UF-70]EDO01801.1 predicted protein [Sclerotinia sclerotiorum 1980 UF-70]